jgi:hypothetical protein
MPRGGDRSPATLFGLRSFLPRWVLIGKPFYVLVAPLLFYAAPVFSRFTRCTLLLLAVSFKFAKFVPNSSHSSCAQLRHFRLKIRNSSSTSSHRFLQNSQTMASGSNFPTTTSDSDSDDDRPRPMSRREARRLAFEAPLYSVGGAHTGHDCLATCRHPPEFPEDWILRPDHFKLGVRHGFPDRAFQPVQGLLCQQRLPHSIIEVRSHLAFIFVIGYKNALRWFTLHQKKLTGGREFMSVYWFRDNFVPPRWYPNTADVILTGVWDPDLDAWSHWENPEAEVDPIPPVAASVEPNWFGPPVAPRVIPDPDCFDLMRAVVDSLGDEPLIDPPTTSIYGRWIIYDPRNHRGRLSTVRYLRVAFGPGARTFAGFFRRLFVHMEWVSSLVDLHAARAAWMALAAPPPEPEDIGWEPGY